MKVKLVLQAVPPIIAGGVLTVALVVARNDTVARTHQNQHAVTTACTTTHNGLTDVISAVGVAIEQPPADGRTRTPQERTAAKRFVVSLQAAADRNYTKCLAGVPKS